MKNFNFKTGEVVLNDFDLVDNLSLPDQIWSLKEDILQVRYKGCILDLGWYPEFNLEEGCFKLVVVRENDWLNPILCKKTQSITEVVIYIDEAIEVAEQL